MDTAFKASREAGKYRRQLRAVEADRDQLQAKLNRLTRCIIEDIARSIGIARPDTLWRLGFAAEVVQAPDGTIDYDRARQLIRKFAEHEGLNITPN